jgi:hypothetical protein
MPTEQLTYADLADRLKCSPEAARSLAKRLRLPRQPRNDGKTLLAVDLAEIQHKPMPARSPGCRSPAGHRRDAEQLVAALKAKITELEDEIAQLEIAASGHRADFERERERCDVLMRVMLKRTAELMTTKEAAAHFGGELAALRSRRWWQRLAG